MDPCQRTDNRQPMVDRESPIGKGSWSQDKIPSKQQVRVKEGEDLDDEGPWTEKPLEENPHQREGSRAPSRLEGKTHHPPGPLGSSPFSVQNPNPPKGGGDEAREGGHLDGERNKSGAQASGGPELSRPSPPSREPSTGRRGTRDHREKLDRDRFRVLQL